MLYKSKPGGIYIYISNINFIIIIKYLSLHKLFQNVILLFVTSLK